MSENSVNSGSDVREPAPVPPPALKLPAGKIGGGESKYPEPERRLREWARENGYKIKYVHTHHMGDESTFFAIFEASKGS